VFYLENSDISEISGEIKNIIKLIEKERPDEIRLFRKWIKNFFYGNDEISDEIQNGIKEIEEVKDMLSTSLKKRDKMQFQQGVQQGHEKGIQEGIQKGIQKKAADTAKALLKENMSANKISEITGLSLEEIKKLK